MTIAELSKQKKNFQGFSIKEINKLFENGTPILFNDCLYDINNEKKGANNEFPKNKPPYHYTVVIIPETKKEFNNQKYL